MTLYASASVFRSASSAWSSSFMPAVRAPYSTAHGTGITLDGAWPRFQTGNRCCPSLCNSLRSKSLRCEGQRCSPCLCYAIDQSLPACAPSVQDNSPRQGSRCVRTDAICDVECQISDIGVDCKCCVRGNPEQHLHVQHHVSWKLPGNLASFESLQHKCCTMSRIRYDNTV